MWLLFGQNKGIGSKNAGNVLYVPTNGWHNMKRILPLSTSKKLTRLCVIHLDFGSININKSKYNGAYCTNNFACSPVLATLIK